MEDNGFFRQAADMVKEAGQLFNDRSMASRAGKKGATDFVTDVDIAVQRRLRERLKGLAPDIQLMGEEKDNSDIDFGGRFWILDPVDGTTNLMHNFRHSAVSLALAEAGELAAGIVYDPYADELFAARRGEGAFLNGAPIAVSGVNALSDSLCSVGTNPSRREQAGQTFRWLREIYDSCHDIRRIGAASIEMCYVACGRLEGFVERGLSPWDYAAGMLIVREAGGMVTSAEGSPPSLCRGGAIAASNGKIHSELLSLLNRQPPICPLCAAADRHPGD